MRENDKLEDNKLERVVAVLHMISNYEPVIMVHEQALLVIPAFLWRLRSRTWIGTGSQVDMRGTLFVIVCVIVCLVSFVGIRSRPWIEIGCPSRYAPHFICDCMCHCLSRFARCIAQSSLDWNWPSKSTCVARYVSLYVLLVVHFVLHVGLRSRPWIGIGLPSAFCRI